MDPAEAAARLERHGPNEVEPPPQESQLLMFIRHMLGGFALLLWAGALACFVAYGVQLSMQGTPQMDNVRAATSPHQMDGNCSLI